VTLHFIHIRKTGGTAIKRALGDHGLAAWSERGLAEVPRTPYGPILLHRHAFRLSDVPDGEHAFFCVRDPVSRFVSRFQSRLNQGLPGHFYPWNEAEERIFARYPTPDALAQGLAADTAAEREQATWAMIHLRHQTHMRRWLGAPGHLRVHLRKIAYIARQETLEADFERLKDLLGLPAEVQLPSGARAHRSHAEADLGERALRGLHSWYAVDYELLRYCDRLRVWRGWPEAAPAFGDGKLAHELSRLRSIGVTRPTVLLARNRAGRLYRRVRPPTTTGAAERRP
jgi:hypothetical protein